MSPPLVLVESPYAAPDGTHPAERLQYVQRNLHYARRALHDSFMRGEYPWCSHLIYTQPGVLDDDVPEQRELGIEAGLTWGLIASMSAVYADFGISRGMQKGIQRAHELGRVVVFRYILRNERGEELAP
jgi:hypothetical protein